MTECVKIKMFLDPEKMLNALETAFREVRNADGTPVYLIIPHVYAIKIFGTLIGGVTLKNIKLNTIKSVPVAYSYDPEFNISEELILIVDYP